MARGISVKHTWPFVVEEERTRPEADQTKFILGVLSGDEWVEVTAAGLYGVDITERSYRMALAACRYGVRGWSNLKNDDDMDIPFPGRGMAATSCLPMDILASVGLEIQVKSRTRGIEAGKSEPPLVSPLAPSGGSASPALSTTQEAPPAGDAA